MSCPFARFTRSLGIDSDSDDDSIPSTQAPKKTVLTTLLKDGTWEIHREIEKSPGVRALMGTFHTESSLQLDRLSHLKFLIMLACIYLAMEAKLFREKTVLSDMMFLLVRSRTLLEDIQVHLDEILDTTGAEVEQLDAMIDAEARFHHEMIFARIQIAQKRLIAVKVLDISNSLTIDHIALLDKRQALATFHYVEQLSIIRCKASTTHKDEGISFTPLATPSTSRSTSSISLGQQSLEVVALDSNPDGDTILSHAYVRYMGDLSGGQHIVKRLSKLFPIFHLDESDSSKMKTGFSFYHFDSESSKSSIDLKSMIRNRLNTVILSKNATENMVNEASLAFRLNGKLLDSLVDEESSTIEMENDQIRINQSKWSMAYTLFQHPSYLSYFISPAIYHPHSLVTMTAIVVMVSTISMYTMSA